MPEPMDNKPFDVVIDITLDDQNKAIELFETLLVLEEGMPSRYWIQLGQRRLIPALQELIILFQARKSARLSYDLPAFKFPQELIDKEAIGASQSEKHRITLNTKRSWFARNLVVFKAISQFGEFIYLTPDAVIMKNGWLAELKAASEKCALPVQGYSRKLKVGEAHITCGWSTIGWYKGQELRKLPLSKMLRERILNPWKGISVPGQQWQPSFCLAQDWLSSFDMPLGYVLFALYFQELTETQDTTEWDRQNKELACDLVKTNRPDDEADRPMLPPIEDAVIIQELGVSVIGKKNLRQQYFNAAKKLARTSTLAVPNDIHALPVSGPKYNIIDNNRRKQSLEDLRNMFIGERCFIIGNGPSLKKTNLRRLKDEYTIGLNRIYLNFANMGFQTTFLCVTNPNVLRQFGNDIDQINSIKFLRYHNEYIHNKWNVFFMEHTGFHSFVKDLREFKWCEGCTVTYCAMQVAFFLGFETVILVGVDHNFIDAGKPHQLVTSNSEDANHFHPEYWGKGVEWQYPDLAGSEVSYRVADAEYKRDGRIILDATVGGALKIFKKCEFEAFFD